MSKEIHARVLKSSHLPHMGTTEVTLEIPGEHNIRRSENVVIVVNEAGK